MTSVRTAANLALWLIFKIASSVSGWPPARTESAMSKKPGMVLKFSWLIESSGVTHLATGRFAQVPIAELRFPASNQKMALPGVPSEFRPPAEPELTNK